MNGKTKSVGENELKRRFHKGFQLDETLTASTYTPPSQHLILTWPLKQNSITSSKAATSSQLTLIMKSPSGRKLPTSSSFPLRSTIDFLHHWKSLQHQAPSSKLTTRRVKNLPDWSLWNERRQLPPNRSLHRRQRILRKWRFGFRQFLPCAFL